MPDDPTPEVTTPRLTTPKVPAALRDALRGTPVRRGGRAGRVTVRPYRRSDDAGLVAVCLATADDGDDGSTLYRNPDLPGAVYAVPYVRFEPDLCLVLDDGTPEGRVSGYVLGTSDTVAYEQWLDRAWWPGLRRRFPVQRQPQGSADARLAGMAEEPELTPAAVTDRYPAHLHIDLMPHVQGQGWGRRLVDGFMQAAAGAGATGVHLGVSEENTRAIGFYSRLGFHLVQPVPGALLLGRPLP